MSAGRTTSPRPDHPALRDCLAPALAALCSGRGVLAVGPAGIGKSHALRSVASALGASGEAVATVTATASMASVPLGALLPLRRSWGPGQSDAEGLTAAAAALRAELLDRPDLVLAVDDAHLLDPPSAGVLHQVAVAGLRVLATARAGAPLHDAVARLVDDARAEPVDIAPLTEAEVATLLREVLGGPVDDRLCAVVHARTGGVPLAAAALARLAVRSGSARESGGRWLLDGYLPHSAELGALVSGVTDALGPRARRAAELVALTEDLVEPELDALGAREGAEEAERAGVLTTTSSGSVRVAHPLYSDALLAQMPRLHRRRRLAELADADPGDGHDAPHPVEALARVRRTERDLELGRPCSPSVLLELAGLVAASAPSLSERFARAAVDAGEPTRGRLRLAEVLAHQHRADEAETVLSELDVSAVTPQEALAAEITRCFMLVFVLARPEDALERLAGRPPVPVVSALRASAHYVAGRLDVAAAAARAVVDDVGAPPAARAHAALTLVSACALRGLHEPERALLVEAEGLVAQVTSEIPEGVETLRLVEALCPLRTTLDLPRSRAAAQAGYRRALDRGDDGERAQWALLLGIGATLSGDSASAVDLLRQAALGRGRWASANAGWVAGWLVVGLVLVGDLPEAERVFARLDHLRHQPVLLTDRARCAAVLASAQRDLSRAGSLVEAVARSGAAGRVDAWYDAVRYARTGAPRAFLEAAADLPGAGRAAQRAHAAAAAERDPVALEQASHALAAAGLGWYAVDAMAAAVRLHARRDPGDGAPAERLRLLRAQHPALRSPLAEAVGRPGLTHRESEVALLAAGGQTARTIASHLGIGVRTVETHLAHSYRKLGVQDREGLRKALGLS